MMAYHEYFPMAEGKEEMSSYVDNIGKVGGESKGARDLFQDIDSGGTYLWGIDVGDDPLRGPGLGGFQHRVAQWITGRQPWRLLDGVWEYPPLDTAIQEAGFEEMEAYVLKSHNTVLQYIVT